MTTQTTSPLHIVGTTDEQTECDRCGRVELKCTVILADADGVEAGRYGTSCASTVLGVTVTKSDAVRINNRRRREFASWLSESALNRDAGFLDLAAKYLDRARALAVTPAELAAVA